MGRTPWQKRKAIHAYLEWLQDILNLTEWTVRLCDTPADEGNAAEIQPVDGSRVANLFLAPDFLTFTKGDIRRYLIHELLHLHHQDAEQVIDELAACLSKQEHTLAANLHRHACEVMVDQQAIAWAALLAQTRLDRKHLAAISGT
jgi:hypothetical protein